MREVLIDHCMRMLRQMEARSVQCVVTSPPEWRRYSIYLLAVSTQKPPAEVSQRTMMGLVSLKCFASTKGG